MAYETKDGEYSYLPKDLKTFVFPSGTESFPEITSPISPETDALCENI